MQYPTYLKTGQNRLEMGKKWRTHCRTRLSLLQPQMFNTIFMEPILISLYNSPLHRVFFDGVRLTTYICHTLIVWKRFHYSRQGDGGGQKFNADSSAFWSFCSTWKSSRLFYIIQLQKIVFELKWMTKKMWYTSDGAETGINKGRHNRADRLTDRNRGKQNRKDQNRTEQTDRLQMLYYWIVYISIDIQTDIQTDRQTNKQTNKTDRRARTYDATAVCSSANVARRPAGTVSPVMVNENATGGGGGI